MNGSQLLLTSAILCIILYVIYHTLRGIYMATVSIRMDDDTKAAFEGCVRLFAFQLSNDMEIGCHSLFQPVFV